MQHLPLCQQRNTFLAMPSSFLAPQSCRLLYAGCPPACSSESSGIRWQLTGPVWRCDSARTGSRCRQVRAPGGWPCQVCQTILSQSSGRSAKSRQVVDWIRHGAHLAFVSPFSEAQRKHPRVTSCLLLTQHLVLAAVDKCDVPSMLNRASPAQG